MSLRVIIADDEPLARERLRCFLADEPEIELIAECEDGAQALDAIEQMRPDLVLLDVQMPRLSGFEVLEALPVESMPEIIFATAHDEHAIHAFEVNALDYLLKPCTEERFRKAMQRAREQCRKRAGHAADSNIASLLAHLRAESPGGGRILIKSPERILFLKPDEIDHVEAAGNYVVLHAGKERHILRETMAAMEARLSPSGFMRVSRSIILNLARVREVQPSASGHLSVLLRSGTRLDMTCSLRELQEKLAKV